MASDSASSPDRVPVLLLKTKSSPTDAYQDIFSVPNDDGFPSFEPIFVPVLQHRFEDDGMQQFEKLLRERRINRSADSAYGGLIFTSQRAVEAFAKLVDEGKGDQTWPHLQDIPVYSVGPATTRALKAIPQTPPLQIFGEHTGNGDALARFILDHYGEWYKDRPTKPPLLFLVGEQRRDIIPKTLMDEALPDGRQIEVTEIVLYGTGVMESFASDFADVLQRTTSRPERWVVVFSPTGCDSMLKGLDLLDQATGKAVEKASGVKPPTSIATIGPTTANYLKKTFHYEAKVCAKEPTPEGVRQGILDNMVKDI
ncbi:tetrapyrrole biosynthesis, uroporphyrinogen III synthase [Daldinia vernicosa]|uniref:tetrapyrrole biosynthesis, uroporphyrinogen III synthase n=1 Tax=Daldinia vernicosa TaxID=114800 RepID=UPI00200749C2|nr:tetrapyrrole biosynthesis, uroporphyrinogen III synthase [Daldinia vernicosa]KAI0845345.1 tetrapyrrole biosynthesis, uroporphyrinogen III synthase [Daldinia vernicosa]